MGVPGCVWLFIPPKGKAREGVRLAPRLHRAALISRIKIPRQLLPKWLRAVQGGWETPGAVTGRRRQTKSSLRHSGSAPGGENQHTHTHTPRSTSPPSPRRPDTRMPPKNPKRAGVQWAASLPVFQPHPSPCRCWMSILADPWGWVVPAAGHRDVAVEGTGPPAVQPPPSHPCVRGERVSLRGVSPQGDVPQAVSPSGAPASCSNAFCHRVPLWQSCKAAEPSAPLCKDTWRLLTLLVVSFFPSVPISPHPPRKETAARAPQIFIRRGQCCRVTLAQQARGGDAVTCSEVS